MPDKYQSEAVLSLHNLGFGVRADLQAKRKKDDGSKSEWANADLLKEPGRADLLVTRGGRACYIEVKTGSDSFPFSHVRSNQREWMTTYALPEPYATPVWLWLCMGIHPPHYNPSKYVPRRTWLLPYPAWLAIEKQFEGIQESIPYAAKKGMKTLIQERNLDALHLLAPWELKWAGKGTWTIGDSHEFYATYIATSLPLYTKGDYQQWLPITANSLRPLSIQ